MDNEKLFYLILQRLMKHNIYEVVKSIHVDEKKSVIYVQTENFTFNIDYSDIDLYDIR